MKMNKLILAGAGMILAAAMSAQDPEGSLVYSLPSTTVRLQVKAQKENFYAGPYAKYAQKYLGIDVRQKDAVTCTVTSVTMESYTEADQAVRYTIAPGAQMPAFLTLTHRVWCRWLQVLRSRRNGASRLPARLISRTRA